MIREEAIAILEAFMENPLFSDAHKQAFNIAIHDVKQRHDWDINNLILINKETYESAEQEPREELSSSEKSNKSEIPTGSIIDWNNCHTSEQLKSISTTKNDLGVDAVSRDEVCRYVAEFVNHEFSTREEEKLINNIITGIEHLPSVTPQEPRKGHWITRPHVYGVTYCSKCDFELKIDNTNYCPNCGAKMEVEE